MILATRSGWLISVEKVAETKHTITVKERGELGPPYKISKKDPDQKLFGNVDEASAWIDNHLYRKGTKPVYDYRKDGLRFRLYPDGNITVSSKDLPERGLYQLDHDDFGITHKAFNSICLDGIREGDVDDMLSDQARISRERGMKRNAGVELYDALAGLLGIIEDSKGLAGYHMNGTVAKWDDFREVNEAYEALAKARGET